MLRRNGLAKNILQKDIIYYFKYRELSGIFTINYHISDNSIQINTKFVFTVYEYILLSKLIYIYIYIYIYMHIIYIYTFYIYVCIYIYELCVFCLLQHCRNAYTRWSHWFHIQIIFSSWFYFIIVTSRNSLPSCEYDPSYQ